MVAFLLKLSHTTSAIGLLGRLIHKFFGGKFYIVIVKWSTRVIYAKDYENACEVLKDIYVYSTVNYSYFYGHSVYRPGQMTPIGIKVVASR